MGETALAPEETPPMRCSRKVFPLLAIALLSGNAAAGERKLLVTATVMPTCKVSVGVPRVGSEARAQGGTGSFSVVCTQSGAVSSNPDGTAHDDIAPDIAEVRMSKGIVPHPKLDAIAGVADYGNVSVTQVLF